MPFEKFSFGPLFEMLRPENLLPMHRIVVSSVLEILPEPTPHFKLSFTANCDVTQIKQAVNIGSQ